MLDLLEILNKRRSIYNLGKDIPVSEDVVVNLIKKAIEIAPTAFNSQSARLVILIKESHLKFWNIVLDTLKKIVPENKFDNTQKRILSFANGYGTILFFEDMNIVHDLENKYPEYAKNMPIWAEQSNGMLQYMVWSLLANENIGANLQHYNPIIDEDVKKEFNINSSWKLIAQMPFGNILKQADKKSVIDVNQRLKIFK